VRNLFVFKELNSLSAQTKVCGYHNRVYRTASEGHHYEHGLKAYGNSTGTPCNEIFPKY